MGLVDYLPRFGLLLIVKVFRILVRFAEPIGKPQCDEIIYIPSREKGRTIRVHVYKPKTANTSKGPPPVLLNWHGSGFVLPLHGTDDLFCHQVATETSHIVLDATYRLAPEHPWPGPIEDCEDLMTYVLAHPQLYDVSRISVCGFSAGACMALCIAGGCNGLFDHKTKAAIAFYPVTDFAINPGVRKAPQKGGRPIPAPIARVFNRSYLLPEVDKRDGRVSPAWVDPNLFPEEVLVFTCGMDTLANEASDFVKMLKEGRKETVLNDGGVEKIREVRMRDVSHAWDKYAEKMGEKDAVRKREEAYAASIEVLKRVEARQSKL